MGKYLNLAGQRFGMLEVLKDVGRDKHGNVLWLCQCDCGTQKIIRRSSLYAGTKSCGCLKKVSEKFNRENNHNWKGDEVSVQAGRSRALRWYNKGNCEICGKPAHDRHHKDGNTLNNYPDNIQMLCRKCHMKIDGRLTRFSQMERSYMKRDDKGRFYGFKMDEKLSNSNSNAR